MSSSSNPYKTRRQQVDRPFAIHSNTRAHHASARDRASFTGCFRGGLAEQASRVGCATCPGRHNRRACSFAKRRMEEIGAEPIGNSISEMTAQIKSETEKFAKLVKDANVPID